MTLLITIVAFIIAILLLVSLHELGHLIVARLCGVKVLRFSIGFGTPFMRLKWRNIEWCLAPVPLGGYVKMVDTREGNVSAEDLPYAFDLQHPLKRIAIVLAGPVTNLVLAVLLFAISIGIAGTTHIRPWIGMVDPTSIAAQAGFQPDDHILKVNGETVSDWTDAQTKIMMSLDDGAVRVEVTDARNQPVVRQINISSKQADEVAQTGYLGLLPFKFINRVGAVMPDSVADKAGLQTGDTLLAINGVAIPDWQMWVDTIRANAGAKISIDYQRNGKNLQTTLRPESVIENGNIIGRVGIGAMQDEAWNRQVRQHSQPDMAQSVQLAAQRTWSYISMTMEFLGKLVTGHSNLRYLSGPLTIADMAGKTATMGWQSYIEFLALISVSLGVLNLLPIPMLDGGHFMYYAVEWLRGKPLSQRIQQIGMRLGLTLMLMLMSLAFYNDIHRLFG